jgi:nitrous-oxide reductase
MTDDDTDINDVACGFDPDADPASVADEYEAKLESVLADVEEPPSATEGGLELDLLGLNRRDFMKAGAATGAMAGIAGCSGILDGGPAQGNGQTAGGDDHIVPPGEHDEYYGFWSGGQSGEVRVIGIPSMRPLARIPMFSPDSSRGWAHDQKSLDILEEGYDGDRNGAGSLENSGQFWGDNHHPVLSETEGTYDGRYLWINDKANGRVGRVNLKYFETDAITDVPNMQAMHGIAVQSPDTKYVYGVGEFRHPVPNDGRDLESPEDYWSTFAAINPESMEVEWEVRVSGNMDNCDTDKEGRWALATGYNAEEGVTIEEMSRDDRDYVKAFDIDAIESALENGAGEDVNGVTVLDGRMNSDLNSGSNPIVRYVPTPKSPHGLDVEPNGNYAIANGKLSPTCTLIDIGSLGEVDDPADAVVGQPKVGLGPLHTTFDDRGHGYTTLFIDSQVAKWDIEEAAEAEMGSTAPVVGKIDVHYNPGHIQAAEAETVDPAGDWLVSLNKLSKDRFLPVGPIHPDNDQLINISEDADDAQGGMTLAADHPVHPEPHDAVIVHRDKVDPNTVWDREDYEGEKEYVTDETSRVERTGEDSVHVYISNVRSSYGLQDFTVKEGDEVTITTTNVETVRDIVHGLAIPRYGINLAIAPQDTREATFTAEKPGVYWIYCTYFCSALHLEMRSRMIVEPR